MSAYDWEKHSVSNPNREGLTAAAMTEAFEIERAHLEALILDAVIGTVELISGDGIDVHVEDGEATIAVDETVVRLSNLASALANYLALTGTNSQTIESRLVIDKEAGGADAVVVIFKRGSGGANLEVFSPDGGTGIMFLGTTDPDFQGPALKMEYGFNSFADCGGLRITNLGDPVNDGDAIPKKWAEDNLGGGGGDPYPSFLPVDGLGNDWSGELTYRVIEKDGEPDFLELLVGPAGLSWGSSSVEESAQVNATDGYTGQAVWFDANQAFASVVIVDGTDIKFVRTASTGSVPGNLRLRVPLTEIPEP